MRRAAGIAMIAALAALAGSAGLVGAQQPDPFPHADHARLFPLCTGCHAGIPAGDAASRFPDAALCARCHDDAPVERVEWSVPAARHDLRFDHTAHDRLLAQEDTVLACAGCHAQPGTERMMDIYRAAQTTCAGCHAHQTPDHYVTGTCAQCHMPLAESDWSHDRIAAITVPADHEPTDPFLVDVHGPGATEEIARCATCHTQDRCSACHVNASVVPAIQALAVAPAGMSLPTAGARYPVPESHTATAFLENHAPREGSGADCSTCHIQEDCASCHLYVDDDAFGVLFAAADVQAPGVGVDASAPTSHESPYFLADHPALASTGMGLCASCHTQPFCNDCHDDPQAPVFHEPDFVQRHASDAYGRNMECATCHSAEIFCRSCHVESGLGGSGRLTVGYHDAEPVWLLRHGQAARQSLESCQSCHTQRECLQCHSQTGSFQVSPHGPDFDARRAQERNPAVCFACHITDPKIPGG